MKKLIIAAAIALSALGLVACTNDDATVVSANLSKAADNFEITRRIVFINLWTGKYELEVVGLCSQEDTGNKLAVTCKTGPNTYIKNFLGRSQNFTYFSEQIKNAEASKYFYRVTFKPSTIIPDIRLQ